MKPEIIKKLEQKFDIEIIQSPERLRGENTFDLDEHGNVRCLHLRDIDIKSLDIVAPLAENLLELSLTGTNVKDTEILKDFIQLEYLNLSFNPIPSESLMYLCELKKLKELQLKCTDITDTSSLGGIVSLEKLFFYGSDQLDCIDGLEGLTNLIQLDISSTKIRDFRNVHVSDSIRLLNAESTIDKISELDRFPNLEELYLMSNCFEKIEGLDQLKSLKRLNLFDSGISEIQGLENLINLEILDLGSNKISEIKGLNNLEKIKKISIGFNRLSKVNNLEGLTQLEYLLLDGNYINEFDAKFLTDLTKDCTISICNNPIKSIEGVIPSNVQVEFESIFAVYRTLF